jgi:hypothetical protein
MTEFCQQISDRELRELAAKNLVASQARVVEAELRRRGLEAAPEHDCMEHAYPHATDGPLGHGWSCGVCGALIQVG